MEKRILGKELEVSAIGLGCMTIGKDYSDESRAQAIEIIRRACKQDDPGLFVGAQRTV